MNLDPVLDATAEIFGVNKSMLTGRGRARRLAIPRFAFYYAVRETTGLSLPTIGLAMGGRDHTSVMHGLNRASEFIREDADFAVKVERLVDFAAAKAATLRTTAEQETLQRRYRRATYYVLASLERLAIHNPAGFDQLMLWAGSYDPTHHH